MNRLGILLLLLFTAISVVQSQSLVTKTAKLENASIMANGELKIIASKNSSSHDFDFLAGEWNVHHRKLKTRLNRCTEWIEFESTVDNRTILNGIANLDVNRMSYTGTLYESISLRIFDPHTRLWSLYWADSKTGVMDPAVVGSFEESTGIFYGKNIYNGIPVMVMFRWDKTDPGKPEWRQAYSVDHGETWEWNSVAVSLKKRNTSDTIPVPETFMPKTISTDSVEFNAAFSPDGNFFYFSRSINRQTRIFSSRKNGSSWSAPEPVYFSTAKFSDADPAFSPTGELYFISDRPTNATDTSRDYDIWKVIPLPGNQWSEPVNVQELNSGKDEYYISFTSNGSVCFASSREGGYGEEDLYYCENKNNRFGTPKNLGDKINSIHSEYDPFITSDGSAVLFTSSGRKDSFGKGDLYWSVRTKDGWPQATHFGQEINTPTRDFCPYITADSKYFFFSSKGDIKFISTEKLPEDLQGLFKK
jgi:hypothetical protein